MTLLRAALCALTLAACNQVAEQTDQPDAGSQVAENGCPAAASGTWQGLQVEASANGADCATAQATLSIGSNGATLWSETYPANQVMVRWALNRSKTCSAVSTNG